MGRRKEGETLSYIDPYHKEIHDGRGPKQTVDKMTSLSGMNSHLAGLELTQWDGCPPTKADLVSLTVECSSYEIRDQC